MESTTGSRLRLGISLGTLSGSFIASQLPIAGFAQASFQHLHLLKHRSSEQRTGRGSTAGALL